MAGILVAAARVSHSHGCQAWPTSPPFLPRAYSKSIPCLPHPPSSASRSDCSTEHSSLLLLELLHLQHQWPLCFGHPAGFPYSLHIPLLIYYSYHHLFSIVIFYNYCIYNIVFNRIRNNRNRSSINCRNTRVPIWRSWLIVVAWRCDSCALSCLICKSLNMEYSDDC